MASPEATYSIRQFNADDAEQYKAMRLEALQLEKGKFGNSYEFEAAFPDAHWRERVNNPLGACFGLYYGSELIGITGIIVMDKPLEAYMTQSYIRAPFRGKGLSKMLYEARFGWASVHGIKTLRIGHRRSNLVSKAANQRYGFQYTHAEARNWPDGASEDMLYYKLEL